MMFDGTVEGFARYMLVAFGGLGVILIVVLIAGQSIDSKRCTERWAPRSVLYDSHAGCRVDVNGQWAPEKNVVIRIEGK